MGVPFEKPLWSKLKPCDNTILIHENRESLGDLSNRLPREVKLIDMILFINSWCYGDFYNRTAELLEALLNIMNGHWVSLLIFRSMKSLVFGIRVTNFGQWPRFPCTIEAIRKIVRHPIFDDEDSMSGKITCGRGWGTTFFDRPGE